MAARWALPASVVPGLVLEGLGREPGRLCCYGCGGFRSGGWRSEVCEDLAGTAALLGLLGGEDGGIGRRKRSMTCGVTYEQGRRWSIQS